MSLLPGDRTTGTFLQPTTLGLFCVIVLVFFVCFAEPWPRRRANAATASGIVVIASASAWLLYLLAVAYTLVPPGVLARRSRAPAIASLVAVGAMAWLALPWLTGRPEVFTSLFGPVLWIELLLRKTTGPAAVLFGEGLGVGTNAAVHWLQYGIDQGTEVPAQLLRGGSTSTVQGLFSQIGVIGILGFYGLLVYAAWRDVRTRPLYVVIGIASLLTNIIEFFPVNVMLGLLLAHSTTRPRTSRYRQPKPLDPDTQNSTTT